MGNHQTYWTIGENRQDGLVLSTELRYLHPSSPAGVLAVTFL